MNIYTKYLVDFILTPLKVGGLTDKGKKVALGISIGLGVASLGSVHLICLIMKKCFSEKQSSASNPGNLSQKSTVLQPSNTTKVSQVSNPVLVPSKSGHSQAHSSEKDLFSFDSQKVTISPKYHFFGKQMVLTDHLQDYFTYIAVKNPKVFVTEKIFPIGSSNIEQEIDAKQVMAEKETYFPFYLNIGTHWVLVFIDKEKRTVEYYDSKKNYGDSKGIQDQLKKVAANLSEQDPTHPPFHFIHKTNIELQPDGYQCGVWVMYFLTKRLEDPNFDFDQMDVDKAQPMIADFRDEAMQKLEKLDNVYRKHFDKEWQDFKMKYRTTALEKFNAAWKSLGETETLCKIKLLQRWNQKQRLV